MEAINSIIDTKNWQYSLDLGRIDGMTIKRYWINDANICFCIFGEEKSFKILNKI